MGGDKHYYERPPHLLLPEIRRGARKRANELCGRCPADVAAEAILARGARGRQVRESISRKSPKTRCRGNWQTSSPGASPTMFNFHGPNYVVRRRLRLGYGRVSPRPWKGLDEGDYDAVITGGVDANMSASSFVKFCKIGALSATGTRPYADGADGFVMGEGAADLPAQAPGRRRARRRHDLRACIRGTRRRLRRQGQGHHGAQPHRPVPGHPSERWEERGPGSPATCSPSSRATAPPPGSATSIEADRLIARVFGEAGDIRPGQHRRSAPSSRTSGT